MGFFLHIRSRRPGVCDHCPAIGLGRDLTEYDVVGLHTRTDVEQLTDYLTRELHARDEGGDVLSTGTRRVRLLPCPIGIDVREVEKMAASAEAKRQAKALGPRSTATS